MGAWDWGYALEVVPLLLPGLQVTVELTVFGSLLAYGLGLVIALLRQLHIPVLDQVLFLFVEFIRSTPLLVQVFFFWFVLQPALGILPSAYVTGILALGVHYACYTSEVYRAGIEAVPKGQWEAATALSLPRGRVWTSVVLPQAVPRVLPALGNYTISMFKETPLLLGIGVFEVLNSAKQEASESFRAVEPYTMAGVYFLIVSYLSSLLVRRLEKRVGTV
jgi:polar amino acid transport system permease protein